MVNNLYFLAGSHYNCGIIGHIRPQCRRARPCVCKPNGRDNALEESGVHYHFHDTVTVTKESEGQRELRSSSFKFEADASWCIIKQQKLTKEGCVMSQSEEKPQNQAKSNWNNATFFQYPKKKWSYDDDVCTISATLNFFLTEIFDGHMVFQTWVHHTWQSVSKLWMPEDNLLPPLHKQRLCIKNFKALVTDHHTIKAISMSSLSFCENNNHHEYYHWTVPTPIRFILNLQQ